jgi:hypothetical protein
MNDQDIIDIMQLIYHNWSHEMQLLDYVKNETNDGSPDWEEMHADRLFTHSARERKAHGLMERFKELNQEAINRGYGL